jgi:hypothetical protein
MSSSFGHAIAPMGGLDTGKAFGHVYSEARQERLGYGPTPDAMVWRPGCSGRRCDAKPVYVTRYLYVTGRAGRVTDRIQYCCKPHGEAFAKKNGLTLEAS